MRTTWIALALALSACGTDTDPTPPDREPDPADLDPEPFRAEASLCAGTAHVCALSSDGVVRCFGGSAHRGTLGIESDRDVAPRDARPVPTIERAIEISCGNFGACALLEDGSVRCWGEVLDGDVAPREVRGIEDATGIAAGWRSLCAIRANGRVSCLGLNWDGSLGSGDRRDSESAREIAGLENVAQLAGGSSSFYCARTHAREVACWGDGRGGALGRGDEESSARPAAPASIALTSDLSVGDGACAVMPAGRVSCWGEHDSRLFDFDPLPREDALPRTIRGLHHMRRVFVGRSQAYCALGQDGSTWCWGDNESGALGIGPRAFAYAPERAPDPSGLGPRVEIACGNTFCCGLHADGEVSCAGEATFLGERAELARRIELAPLGPRTIEITNEPIALLPAEVSSAPAPPPCDEMPALPSGAPPGVFEPALVGEWSYGPASGAGAPAFLRLYSDQRFCFDRGETSTCYDRVVRRTGRWGMVGDTLVLAEHSRVELTGGERNEDPTSGMCYLDGANERSVQHATPANERLSVAACSDEDCPGCRRFGREQMCERGNLF
jgi:hypothetical protein